MTITFVSNFINHHQVHLADALAASDGVDYHFIETVAMPESFAKSGYPDYSSRPYVISAYKSPDLMERARRLIDTSDVVVFSEAPEEWLRKRIKDDKVTFHYSERWFKRGAWRLLHPNALKSYYLNHTRFRGKRSYMLCASAFTAPDTRKVFAYPDKCFKWGYFPKIETIEATGRRNSDDRKLKIIYIARFIAWKHPELPVRMAAYLKRKGYEFSLDMYGTGPELPRIKRLIEELGVGDTVHLCGNRPNDEILRLLASSDIFVFTSDRNEGWGAVVNEAMSQGCAVVASDRIGSVPFLIENGENGLWFKDRSLTDLCSKVEMLFNDRPLLRRLGDNARTTMQQLWSPANAAASFIRLAKSALDGNITPMAKGPGSKAN